MAPRRQLIFDALRKRGCIVNVILWDRSGLMPRNERHRGLSLQRIYIKANYVDLKSALKLPVVYAKFLKAMLKEDADTIICGHFFLLPLAVVFARRVKSKVVYDVMEYYIENLCNRLPLCRGTVKRFIYLLEKILVCRVDGVTTIPSYKGFLLKRLKMYKSNAEEIKNVPIIRDGSRKERLECVTPCWNHRRTVIYAGTISEEWGTTKLLKAIVLVKEKYPDIKLLIIGKTRNNYEDVISHFVGVEAISSNVSFIGFIPYRDLSAYFQVAFAGIVPMQPVKKFGLAGNGTSRKVFEYMYAGLPVVASDFGELAQAVREENCGIMVDSTKPEQIADAIIFLLNNPEEARKMGERGRKAVEKKYNWQIESQKLLKVFDNL